MPAIITDQYRILNAETFVDSFVGIGTTGNNNYYTFMGHPNPKNIDVKNYGASDWGNPVPNPVDAFDQENFYYDSMLFLKKVTPNDVRRVVPRLDWQTGTIYEMYRNNYSSTTSNIKDAAVDGKIETVVIKNGGSGYSIDDSGTVSSTGTISGIPITGDGAGGTVTININSGVVESISGVVGGTGYTYASVRFEAGTFGGKTLIVGTGAEFEVV